MKSTKKNKECELTGKEKLIEEIERTYNLRGLAARRLRVQDFWTNILGIYYSVFTAILAVIGVREDASFIALPSACFTVAVAILVCFANAQNFAGRAHDLEVNVLDLKNLKCEIEILSFEGENAGEQYKEYYKKYYKKCEDSEKHGVVDEYYQDCNCMYGFIKAFFFLFLVVLFMLPFVYIIFDLSKFKGLI